MANLRFVKQPWNPTGSISAPDKKTISKESILWRDAWKKLAKWVWVVKWVYDSTAWWLAQLARMLGRMPVSTVQSIWNKVTGNNTSALTDAYDRATSFVDKPDEYLENVANDLAWKDWGWIMREQWEWLWEAATLLSPLVWLSSPSKVAVAENAVKSLLKNPWKYSQAEALNIIRNRAAIPPTTTEKVMQSVGKWTENLLQKIWKTKLFKAIDKAQVEKAAKELWVDLDTLTKPAKNTSIARANATKQRNMSAQERAARERAEDSANELEAYRLRNEAWNTSLDDMYKYWKSQQNW